MTIGDLLRALDDPTRLRLLRLLSRMELAVGELAEVLDQSQPRISRHVRILTEAGLAEKRKEGSWVFLRSRLHDPLDAARGESAAMRAAADRLLAAAEREDSAFAAECAADRQRLDTIRTAREASAARYFERHAEEWDSLRSLHVAEREVEAELARLLRVGGRDDAESADGASLGELLDVGTGTGRMAELFAPAAAHVAGIDKSPEMLRLARTRLQNLSPARLTLLQGDFRALPFPDARFDTVLFHLVLHYAQAPEDVLAEAARVTRPGGRIAIVDFAAHRHEELRESHAHARLGFTDTQMHQLLTHAGYTPAADSTLPGKELTVRIWTGLRDDMPLMTPTSDFSAKAMSR
ncbi:metalloregulator ArsR/SmtB family transcription factor [uncultured Croceicoccus sp.]|uniref:ArsR/SmtB family transcription factor n=1 Tax=uncultured Croceicoccus sp. TaxID=1295329 RepID=UPI0026285316|nr:metalloregulator ArsR/SmtB family transcription factor [uncultured Croceicoccus sp.]